MRKVIVVVFGNAGHGKDTVADMLAFELQDAQRIAFADPIKHAAMHFLGIPKEVAYGSFKDKQTHMSYGKPARHWLQWLGTEIGRDRINRNIWVHRAGDRALRAEEKFTVVSDGRFYNEHAVLDDYTAHKAVVFNVLVTRKGAPEPKGKPRTLFWRVVSSLASWIGINVGLVHGSEYEVWEMRQRVKAGEPLFDCVFENDGTLGELEQKVRAFAVKLLA